MADLQLALAAARAHHILVVPEGVGYADIHALAASYFPDVYPQDEYTFALAADYSISGAYGLASEIRRELDIPAWAHAAFVAHVPPDRGAALPSELAGIDPVWDAYPEGLPQGEEARALDFFRAAARRLGGALVLAGGSVVVPDPDERPDLSVYSPIWLDPDTLDARLAPILAGARSSLQDADSYELAEDVVLDAYSIYAPIAGGQISIEVQAEEFLPPSIAAFDWAAGGAVAYAVRFIAENEDQRQLSLAQRRERSAAARVIEAACRAIVALAPGVVADDDGFLVDIQ
ncbi:hypothetical protein [Bowdeniella massiliensis]|uniref:hypothetical protein n=1 Tax=Bowdeniella massiliensis TaxID=2932264 RepID=UPI002028A30E|nr:hypothetical protein [Bowdeniella massiliensis]